MTAGFTKKKRDRAGFTLAEILVSMAITGILMVILLSLVGSGSDSYEVAQRDIRSRIEARGALHFFQRDFDSRVGGRTITVDDASEGSGYESDAIGFLVFKIPEAQEAGKAGGEVCYTRYYTAVTPDGSGRVSRKLYRQFLSSTDTFPKIPEDPKTAFPRPSPDPATDEIIATNVVQFGIRLLDRTESGEWIDQKEFFAAQAALPEDQRGDFAPEALETTLHLTDHQTARRLTTEADWNNPGFFGTETAPKDDAPLFTYRSLLSLE